MPNNQPSIPVNKILPKVKKWLDKVPITSEDRHMILEIMCQNPRLLKDVLETDLQRRRNERLQPIDERIKQPTPYLETLLRASRESCDAAYKEKVGQLIVYEINDCKTPLNAWRAAILSAEVQMPLPVWAGTFFRNILEDYIYFIEERRDLATAFELKGVRGKDSKFHKELLQRRDYGLSRHVRFFCLRGIKVQPACILVANRVAEECRRDGFNETIYKLFPAPFKPKTFARTLAKKIYPRWVARMQIDGTLAQVDTELARVVTEDVFINHLSRTFLSADTIRL